MDTDWADDFYAESLITEVLTRLKSGKEATVYLCRGGVATSKPLVAAKVYHQRRGRGFQNRAAYRTGRLFGGSRPDRAVSNGSRIGRLIEESCWVDHEFDIMCALHNAGADVPEPVAVHANTILMEYFGSEDAPAPRLREIEPEPGRAEDLYGRLMWNIECFLANNVIHADLSPFNILIADGRATVIDFPQAADPRINENARAFLARDVANVCRYFERFGVKADACAASARLWERYVTARL